MTSLILAAVNIARLSLTFLVLTVVFFGESYAQFDESIPPPRDQARSDPPPMATASYPNYNSRIHMNGYFWTAITNAGIIGNYFGAQLPDQRKTAPSFYYPTYSRVQYGYYAGLWVGGVVGNDTLVTTAIDEIGQREFFPDMYPLGDFNTRSNVPTSPYYDRRASGELEFHATFTDTFENHAFVPYNSYDNRSHKPLNLQVSQSSYSWSHRYAQDLLIVNYRMANLGTDTIKSAWVGMYYSGCAHHRSEMPYPFPDDVEGYIYSRPHEFEELGDELLKIAWIVDKDGWAQTFGWDFARSPHVFGIAPLHVPTGATEFNFNWWNGAVGPTYNWGPRREKTTSYPFRSFYGGLGMPLSDANRYYLMSKPEIDYGGYESALDHSNDGWLEPPRSASRNITNQQPHIVTSFGPFTMPPGSVESFAVALVMGEDEHTDPMAYRELFRANNPKPFLDYLNLEDLVTNVRWAQVIYDNPGVDTDQDGDSGKSFIHWDPVTMESVQVFYEGDGVPDYRGASPPPPPQVRVSAENGRIILKWNGYDSENHIDPMTRTQDFEGYRVYLSRSELEQEATLLASIDHENFSRYRYDPRRNRYELREIPFTLDSLQILYGESFDPLRYTHVTPFEHNGVLYYFEPVDYNQSDYMDPDGIHKLYPDALLDTSDVDEEGRMRYYEWEYTIDGLLPTVPYWVAVTAHDFGHPGKSLDPLESSIGQSLIKVFALDHGDAVLNNGKLDVYVYPNPYKVDNEYYRRGLENRHDETGTDRARTIYFANLPHRCRITIYSLDGDLVQNLIHDEPPGSGTSSVHRWNLVTRNNEAVVTGLYYWVVESEFGNQIGKLVILK